MSLVLSAVEGLPHDRHPMWRMRWEAQATDMTTNQNLSSAGCGASSQKSQIKATGPSSFSAAAAESIRSSKLLSFGHHQLPALAAVSNNDSTRTQQLQLFLNDNGELHSESVIQLVDDTTTTHLHVIA